MLTPSTEPATMPAGGGSGRQPMGALTGKAVVVTGAGRGIGAAIAAHAAAAGAAVVINDIDDHLAERLAEDLQATGANALAHGADIRSPDEADALVDVPRQSTGKKVTSSRRLLPGPCQKADQLGNSAGSVGGTVSRLGQS